MWKWCRGGKWPSGLGRFAATTSNHLDQRRRVCIIHTMTSAALILEIKQAGWVLDRVRGSHNVFKHPERPGIVVVPHPKKELGTGLVAAIRKQAALTQVGDKEAK